VGGGVLGGWIGFAADGSLGIVHVCVLGVALYRLK
jgi:hypothetical protein